MAAAIIKLGRPAIGVAGYSLCDLQSPSVLQVVRDAGSPERMGGTIAHDVASLNRRFRRLAPSNLVIGRDPGSRLLPSVVGNSGASGWLRQVRLEVLFWSFEEN